MPATLDAVTSSLRMGLALFLFVVVVASPVVGAEPRFVSRTFQEIQTRVVNRDPRTNAILRVKVKEDAYQLSYGLDFSITERQGDVVIILSRKSMDGDDVFERYQLRLDDAMRQELENQKNLKALLEAQEKQRREDQTKKIAAATGGRLAFGTSLDEVEAIKGKDHKFADGAQEAGTFTWIYCDMKVRFVRGGLDDVEPTR